MLIKIKNIINIVILDLNKKHERWKISNAMRVY